MERLWYVAYGTNLSWARFRCYLAGGRPDGGSRDYPGCRDRTEPAADVGVEIPGAVYFTGRSSVWGGGMAVYDEAAPGRVAARAYQLRAEQFVDVLAQEMRRPPDMDLDLSPVRDTGRQSLGPGRYKTLVRVGTRQGLPMVTFTSDDHHDRRLAAPAESYLRAMAAGLRESRDWSTTRIGSYLEAIAGTGGAWTRDEIEAIAA